MVSNVQHALYSTSFGFFSSNIRPCSVLLCELSTNLHCFRAENPTGIPHDLSLRMASSGNTYPKMTVDGTANIQPNAAPCNNFLAHQYGGNHKAGWVARLPDSWLPYVQLARLSPPAGPCLIYFPHIFGILHVAILRRSPLPKVLQTIRGAVPSPAALLFTATQAVGAALFLPCLPHANLQNVLYALPSIIGWTYYPWAKRHTKLSAVGAWVLPCLGHHHGIASHGHGAICQGGSGIGRKGSCAILDALPLPCERFVDDDV